jgi:hypothetical protein
MESALRTSERLGFRVYSGVHQTGLGERAPARDLSQPRLAPNPVHDVAASPDIAMLWDVAPRRGDRERSVN